MLSRGACEMPYSFAMFAEADAAVKLSAAV
jgi:hypothetical protein